MNIFNAEVISVFFNEHYFLFLASVFLGTFVSVWYIIPKIIWVSNEKQLVKPVIERSVHVRPIPTFGGVAFFMTMVLTLSLVQALQLSYVGNHLIAAITILFMVGLKDDLVVSTARVKLLGQLLAISFLVFSPELAVTGLHGFLGIEEIPVILGVAIGAFILLAIINSYNLIDGIDGLASVIGMVIGAVYAGVFYLSGEHFYVLVSLSLVGMLGGFLRYNFSRGDRKIFMGDSGALIIGLVIGFLTLKVLNISSSTAVIDGFLPENRLLFVLAVLYIPFLDTTRSIIIRLLNKKSPFEPDRNHTHHVLLDTGFTHKQATLILGFLNLVVVGVFVLLSSFFGSWMMTLSMIAIFGITCFVLDRMKKAAKPAPAANTIDTDHETIEDKTKTNGQSKSPQGIKVRLQLKNNEKELQNSL